MAPNDEELCFLSFFMNGDDLVESWQICCGWAEEFCINTIDHKSGLREPAVRVFVKSRNRIPDEGGEIFPGFEDEEFGMRPMCNWHIGNGEMPHPSGKGYHVTRETWELLVQMCGYRTEEDGEVSYETDLIPPKLTPLKNTDSRSEREESEMEEGEILTLAKYAAKVMGLVE